LGREVGEHALHLGGDDVRQLDALAAAEEALPEAAPHRDARGVLVLHRAGAVDVDRHVETLDRRVVEQRGADMITFDVKIGERVHGTLAHWFPPDMGWTIHVAQVGWRRKSTRAPAPRKAQ